MKNITINLSETEIDLIEYMVQFENLDSESIAVVINNALYDHCDDLVSLFNKLAEVLRKGKPL